MVYADYGARYRPRNLISRQRAFLRLMTVWPKLAKDVKSFIWTLIWKDVWKDTNHIDLTDLDRQTWNVFSRMRNVTQLDLASLHEIHDEDFVRQNPPELFPAVIDLKLCGLMHRGLIEALLTSLDPRKLESLVLDYLEDEGSLLNGTPLDWDTGEKYAHHARSMYDYKHVVDDELFQRQEHGDACIFAVPMWLPFRLLSAYSLESLNHLQVRIAPFDRQIDLRNYYTLFQDMVKLLLAARESLTSLVVVFEECPYLYDEHLWAHGNKWCGTWLGQMNQQYHPWAIKLAGDFLRQSVVALSQAPFPGLSSIEFEGFYILETASPHEAATAHLEDTFQAIRDCPFTNVNFTEMTSVDYRYCLKRLGFDCVPNMEGFNTKL